MIKKLALVGIITLTLVGCTNKSDENEKMEVGQEGDRTTQEQNTPDLNRDVEYFTENNQELIDTNVDDLFDNLREPHRISYYINADDIEMIDINNVDDRDIIDKGPVVKEFVYPREVDPKSALYQTL